MAERSEQVSTSGLVDTKQQPGATKRRQYSEALKRQMVAETQVPGASVSIVARRHDVNSNQLFRWRRQLLPKAAVASGAMVPVAVVPDEGRSRRTDREGTPVPVLAPGTGKTKTGRLWTPAFARAGSMSAISGHSPVRARRRRCSSTRPIAKASIRRPI